MTQIENNSTEDKVVEAMKAEAKEAGIPSVFPDDEPKVEETAAKEPEEKKPEPEKEEDKPEEKPKEQNRQSRTPFRETREKIIEGVEKKFEEKYGKTISELQTKLQDYEKGTLSRADVSALEAEIKEKAAELGVDEEQMKVIVSLSRKGLETRLTELEEAKAKTDETNKALQEDRDIKEQEQIFNDEWKTTLPVIKKEYPNATDEQIDKAQTLMDELAFSEKYQNVDLDYVFHKEKESFEKILFSPKVKGMESSSPNEADSQKEEGEVFGPLKITSYKDLEKEDKRMKAYQEGLPDTRFDIK